MEYINPDLIILVLLGFFGFAGFWFGFLHTVGALLGTVAGAFVASRYYGFAADFLGNKFDLSDNSAQVFGFMLVFIVVSRLFGIMIWLVEKVVDLSGIVPFFGVLNRVAGAIIGLVEGVLIVGLILGFSMKFPITEKWKPYVESSGVAQSAISSSQLLWPLVSDSLSFLEKIPDKLEIP